MKNRRLHLLPTLFAGLSLLLFSGCLTVPENFYRNSLVYNPPPVTDRFDVKIRLTAEHAMAAEVESLWRRTGNSETNMRNYSRLLAEVLVEDFVKCQMFTHPVTTPGQPADFSLALQARDYKADNYKMDLSYVLMDLRGGKEKVINRRTLTMDWGKSIFDMNFQKKVPGAMMMIKQSVTADLKKYFGELRVEIEKADAEKMNHLGLVDLLATSDRSVSLARSRNRALIAAKTTQLSDLLRDSKSDDLTALAVRLEQTILDLNHEGEVAKDRAQRMLAADSGGASGAAADELRELAISYRERIELLKPIAAAIKEELANRNR